MHLRLLVPCGDSLVHLLDDGFDERALEGDDVADQTDGLVVCLAALVIFFFGVEFLRVGPGGFHAREVSLSANHLSRLNQGLCEELLHRDAVVLYGLNECLVAHTRVSHR